MEKSVKPDTNSSDPFALENTGFSKIQIAFLHEKGFHTLKELAACTTGQLRKKGIILRRLGFIKQRLEENGLSFTEETGSIEKGAFEMGVSRPETSTTSSNNPKRIINPPIGHRGRGRPLSVSPPTALLEGRKCVICRSTLSIYNPSNQCFNHDTIIKKRSKI